MEIYVKVFLSVLSALCLLMDILYKVTFVSVQFSAIPSFKIKTFCSCCVTLLKTQVISFTQMETLMVRKLKIQMEARGQTDLH